MKAYLSVPLTFINLSDLDYYENLSKLLEKINISLYLPHKQTAYPHSDSTPEYIFATNFKVIIHSDIVIADISIPSHGVGIEIFIAQQYHIPILLLKKANSKISKMVLGIPDYSLLEYKNRADLENRLNKEIERILTKKQNKKGIFISIEGLDYTGKSSICKLLKSDLEKKAYKIFLIEDPPLFEPWINFKTFFETGEKIDKIAEATLLLSSRIDSSRRKIEPKLDDGFIVISDRYSDSWLAYQSIRLENEIKSKNILDMLLSIQEIFFKNNALILPDYTILIIDNPTKLQDRSTTRKTKSKYEVLEIQNKVQKKYLQIANLFNKRIDLVYAEDKSIDQVYSDINKKILNRLKEEIQEKCLT